MLGFAIFAIGLVLNSFQTKSVKLIEGYWRPVGLRLLILENGIQRHSDERSHIGQMQTAKWEPPRWHQFCRNRLSTDRQDFQKASRRRWLRQAARFPQLKKNAEDRIMPKRLGNALRRAEDLAGDRYGIPAVTAVPYLLDVASESMRSIVDDSQTEIDVTTKFVWVWAACSAVAIAAFINDGHDVHG